MMFPAVFWPTLLGLSFLAAGIVSYRRDLGATALGRVFVAAALAAFAGEHFTAAPTLAALVPKWLPGRVFIAYFVGVAHLAAASSFVARRFVRWAALLLAIMFALFVLLMDLPSAVANPGVRIAWSLAAREGTFALGALAIFATETSGRRPPRPTTLALMARVWTAGVLVFYGLENLLYPQYSPGVPATMPTATWVPLPTALAYATGILLIAFGVMMVSAKYAAAAAAACGWLMVLLTVALYVPQFFLARDVPQHVLAINFVFDTLLFAGAMLVISAAIVDPHRGDHHAIP